MSKGESVKVFTLSTKGLCPARPVKATHPTRGVYWRFEAGEEGRGRTFKFFPLGFRDFPGDSERPAADQEYHLLPVSDGKAHILVPGRADGKSLIFWDLSPGYRGSASYTIAGDAQVIAEGYEAQGAAGRMGGSRCPVVLVEGNCILNWHRSGRLYGSEPDWTCVFNDGECVVRPMTPDMEAVDLASNY